MVKMVLLTMTPTIVEALHALHAIQTSNSHEESKPLPNEQHVQTRDEIEEDKPKSSPVHEAQSGKQDYQEHAFMEDDSQDDLPAKQKEPTASSDGAKVVGEAKVSVEPLLSDPKIGNPISHGQIIDLWRDSKKDNLSSFTLEALLQGSRVYVSPPKPKAEPVSSNLTIWRYRFTILSGPMKMFTTFQVL